jgi:hypothetical protein
MPDENIVRYFPEEPCEDRGRPYLPEGTRVFGATYSTMQDVIRINGTIHNLMLITFKAAVVRVQVSGIIDCRTFRVRDRAQYE